MRKHPPKLPILLLALVVVLGLAGCVELSTPTDTATTPEPQETTVAEPVEPAETQAEETEATDVTDTTDVADATDATDAAEEEESLSTPAVADDKETQTVETASLADTFGIPGDTYKLEQVVVLSRHNIRSPLSGSGSNLAKITTHEWFPWTSAPSELSLRGGVLETMNGQFFRQWLEAEELIPANWQPRQREVRFFANSLQRTIATSQYFSSGMLPVANVPIEIDGTYGKGGGIFLPLVTWTSDAYVQAALEELSHRNGATDMTEVNASMREPFELVQDVLDYEDSTGYLSGEFGDLVTTDTQVTLEVGAEPTMTGSLKLATSAADALVLQSYEESDLTAASFGHDLSFAQWQEVGSILGAYNDTLFCSPLIASQVAHPLLAEIGQELDTPGRIFSFLCGHDSNIGSVCAALEVAPYELEGAIEPTTPIGSKLVFERYTDSTGAEYGRVRLVYQSVDQLRSSSMLTPENLPMSEELELEGLQKNADGLYDYDDLRARVQEAADAFDEIKARYGEEPELQDAA